MSKVKLNNGPYTVTSTAPENEYYKYEGNCEQFGQSTSARTSGFWDDNGKGADNSATACTEKPEHSADEPQDIVKKGASLLYHYLEGKNNYNLDVVKSILEEMLGEVDDRLKWMEDGSKKPSQKPEDVTYDKHMKVISENELLKQIIVELNKQLYGVAKK